MHSFIALIVAAGESKRLCSSGLPKQYLQIGQHTILAHTILSLHTTHVFPTRVVIKKEHDEFYRNALCALPEATVNVLMEPVHGGKRRQDSVRIGLESIEEQNPEFVIIHDACRPFALLPDINTITHCLTRHQGMVPAIPLVDTISMVKNGTVEGTIARNSARAIQTPQIFRYRNILNCHRRVYEMNPERDFTDESSVLIACGGSVAAVEGDYNNFKITTAQDIARASEHVALKHAATTIDTSECAY